MHRWTILLSLVLATVGCSSGSGSAPSGTSPPPKTIVGISMNQNSLTLDAGQTETLVASVNYSDGSTGPAPPGSINWSTSNTWYATVSKAPNGDGQITAISRGQATITAELGSHVATATVSVNAVFTRTDVLPGDVWIPPEFGRNLQAIARYTGAPDEDVTADATWNILDSNVGLVSNTSGSKGFLYAQSPGTTQVTATYNSSTGIANVHVMPIRLIGYSGAMYPPPNDLVSGPIVTMDGQNQATASWGYWSGEIFVGGHDGNTWTDRAQANTGQSPLDLIHQHKIASSSSGARVVVWSGNAGLYAVYAPTGQGFGAVRIVPSNLANFASDFRMIDGIGINNSGEVTVVWSAWPGGGTTYRSTYNPITTVWSQPEVLVTANALKVAINPNGDIAFIWQIEDQGTHDMTAYANIFVTGTGQGAGLQTVTTLYVSPWPGIVEIDIRMNANRDAVVGWVEGYSLPDKRLYKAHHTLSSGWHGIGQLPMGASIGALSASVSINDSNEAFLAWSDTGGDEVYAAKYTPAEGWATPQVLSNTFGLGTARVNEIAISSTGNAICIFRDGESNAHQHYKYRQYVVGSGWGPMTTLLNIGRLGESWGALTASYNSAGRGVIAWSEINTVPYNGGLSVVQYNFMELAPNINP